MDWSQLLTNLGIFALSSLSITGLLAFLGKRIFDQYLQAKLEDHRHQLQLIAQSHQIRYSKLHNDRAQIIVDLYTRLYTLQQAMKFYIFPMQAQGEPSREEKRAQAANAAQDFFTHFYRNDIFFDERVLQLVDEMYRLYQEAWVHATTYEKALVEAAQNHEGLDDEAVRAVGDAWKAVDTTIPPIKGQLKSLLQELLGVISTKV